MTEQLETAASDHARRGVLRALPSPADADAEDPLREAAAATYVVDEEDQPVPVDPTDAGDVKIKPADGERQWRPVVPAWVRSRQELQTTSRWAAAYAGHTTAYHVVRAPVYVGKLTLRSPRGALRLTSWVCRWVFDAEGQPVRDAAVRRADAREYLHLTDRRNDRVKLRMLIAGAAAAGVIAAAVALAAAAGPLVQTLAVLAALTALGVAGAPADKPLAGPAVIVQHAQRLTSAAVLRALSSLGIGEINRATKSGGAGITFPAPITRDGPGWRADVDLPHGVTAAHIMDKRYELASGLRRPVGCVWPEPDHDQHAGRLVLWVGDHDMNKERQAAWPLARHGKADIFSPLPFGTDQRARRIDVTLIFNSVLIGAMPRQGKTFAVRVLLLGVALDPIVEMRTFELKGTGDLEPLAKVSHHYGSGADDETIAACLESLREIKRDMERRSAAIRRLPKDVCPENKVTAELAAKRSLRLHPVVFTIDECQEAFAHKTYGKEISELAEKIVKLGPAMGIVLILATQRPDKDSLPTGVSANAGIRFCLRVMGQVENDMILGTSMYKNGVRATTFTAKDKGIGYLVGVADDAQIARSSYLDRPAADRITDRARAARKAAGTLTGYALDEDDATPGHNLLDDVAAVFHGEEKLWSETIVERLARMRPDDYEGWRPAQLSSALEPHGVKAQQVWARTEDGEGRNRNGVVRDHITRAITDRNQRAGVRMI